MKNLIHFINENTEFSPRINEKGFVNGHCDTQAASWDLEHANIPKDLIEELFKGYEFNKWDKIYYEANSTFYNKSNKAINELFPKGVQNYLNDAEWSQELTDNNFNNGYLARWKSTNNKCICVANTGDDGKIFVFIENNTY